MGGFRLRRVHFRPMDGRSPSVPSSVQTPDQQKPLQNPGPKLGDWGCPLRRTATLLADSLLATINHVSYQQPTQFSAMCCLKNTHSAGAHCPTGQLLEGYAPFLRVRNSRDKQSLLPPNMFYAFFTKLVDIFTLRLLLFQRIPRISNDLPLRSPLHQVNCGSSPRSQEAHLDPRCEPGSPATIRRTMRCTENRRPRFSVA
jgi:hypothetical protein